MKFIKKSKKIICLLLACVICVSYGLTNFVFAAEDTGTEVIEESIESESIESETSETTEDKNTTNKYTVTLNQSEHGLLRLDGKSSYNADYSEGSTVGVIIEPDDGYLLENIVLVNSDTQEEYSSMEMSDSAYVFEMPSCNLEVVPTFAEEETDENNEFDELSEYELFDYGISLLATAPSSVTIKYGSTDYSYATSFYSDTVDTHVGGSGSTIYTYSASGYDFYCVEPGRTLYTGNVLNDDDTDLWTKLSSNKKKAILITIAKGYNGRSSISTARRLAMQALIWEIVEGDRDPLSYARTNSEIYKAFFGSSGSKNTAVLSAYTSIATAVKKLGNLSNVIANADDVVAYGTSSLQDGLAVIGLPSTTIKKADVKLVKSSSDTSVSSDSATYSLKGAVYTLYKGKSSDSDGNFKRAIGWSNKTKVATYTTDGNGAFRISDLKINATESYNGYHEAYYIKETTASPGYGLDPTIYCVHLVNGSGSNITYSIYTSTSGADGTWKANVASDTVTAGGTIKFSSEEPPSSVDIKLVKKSSNTSVTSGNDEYSLEGAVYTLYSGVSVNSSGTLKRSLGWTNRKKLGTYTTDSNGAFRISDLALCKPIDNSSANVYYIKETTASPGYGLDPTIWAIRVSDGGNGYVNYNIYTSNNAATWTSLVGTTKVASGTTIRLDSKEPPESLNLSLKKVSASPDETDGNSKYSLKNAIYTLYAGDSTDGYVTGWTNAQKNTVATYTTNAEGSFTIENIDFNSGSEYYYMRETYPSAGYELDPTIWAIHIFVENKEIKYSIYSSSDEGATWTSIVDDTAATVGDTVSITSTEPLDDESPSELTLKKTSADTGFTDGNSCYSLEEAVYYVYSNSSCTTKVGELITTEDGTSNTLTLKAGTYYIKEISASKGYSLCDGTNNDGADSSGVHVVTTVAGETATVECTEPPLNDPFALKLQKYDAGTGETTASGTASLEGAQFEIKYYDNTTGDTTGDALKTWVFETSSSGFLNISNESYLINEKSDELYKDEDGFIIYPLGTYFLKETQAPKYYQIAGTMNFLNSDDTYDVADGMTFVISTDADGNVQVADGGLSLITADNLALEVYEEIQECSVKVVKYDTDGKTPLADVTFRLVGDDGSSVEGTTDSNGIYEFTGLLPQHYVLTEIATVPGHELLKDNIDITLPLEMTKEEAEKSGADVSQAVWDEEAGCYCFYSTTYEVDNSISLQMPVAGGNGMYAVIIAACILVGTGVIVMRRRRA